MAALALLTVAGMLTGCSSGGAARGHALTVTAQDSAGVRIVVLNQSPSDVSRSGAPADTLRANLDLVSSSESFEGVSDVATFRDGRIALLDREAGAIFVFSGDGRQLSRFGRKGDGPGEFRAPIAIAAVGDRLVVLQSQQTNTLIMFDPVGRVSGDVSEPVPGDWFRMMAREPGLPIDSPRRVRTGSEDATRRLRASGDTAFVVQLQLEEAAALDRPSVPQAALVRFDTRLRVLDTLAVVSGVPLRPGQPVFAGAEVQHIAPLFFARPIWVLGDGWAAFGHGRDTALTVKSSAGTPLFMIRWPRTSNPRVSRADRLSVARWVAEYTVRDAPERARAKIAKIPQREVERQIKLFAGILPFADSVPELMAAYPAGECLWLSGFAPADYIDGTSLTWIGIDARTGHLWKVIRIPQRDGRVRHMDATGAYVSYRDSLGLMHLERYAWGSSYCSTLSRAIE